MSRYQPYPVYKDSGVEWFGEMPEYWRSLPARSIVNNLMDKNENAQDQRYLSLMANVGVIRYEDKGDVGNKKPDDLSKCKIVHKGNLVINSMNYSIGSFGMSPYDGVCSPVYVVLSIKEDIVFPRFALRLFENKSFQRYAASFGNGILAHRAAIGWDEIKGAYLPLPPLSEQTTIANFLDHETAKIDTLIEKQQRLIALLKEKRQAVISHAVTKGLDSNVKMKDSGDEWLGEVPKEWKVMKFNYCALIANGQVDPRIKPYNKYILIAPNHIEKETGKLLYFETAADQGADSGKYLSKKGEVIYSKIRPALAKVCISPNNNILCSADMYSIRGINGLTNHFLYWFLLSKEFTRYAILQSDRVAMPKLNRDTLGEAKIPFPNSRVQHEIVEYLNTKTNKIDTLIEKANQAITLLKERRTALISAAVTGKIDVRGEV